MAKQPAGQYPCTAQLCTLLDQPGEALAAELGGELREAGGMNEMVRARRFCESLACLEAATVLPWPSVTKPFPAVSAPPSSSAAPSAPASSSGMLLSRHLASGEVRLMCLVAVQRALSGTLPVWPGVGGGGREQPVGTSPPLVGKRLPPREEEREESGEAVAAASVAEGAGSDSGEEEGEEEGDGGQRPHRRNHRRGGTTVMMPGAPPFGKLRPRQGGGGSRGGQVRGQGQGGGEKG